MLQFQKISSVRCELTRDMIRPSLHRCQERRQVWSCSSPPLSRLLHLQEVWTCLLRSSMALASLGVNSLELTRKKKNSDMKACVDVTLLQHCDSHPPLSQPIVLTTRGKWGREGKQVSPHVIDPLPYLIRQRFFILFSWPSLFYPSLCYARVIGKYSWQGNRSPAHIW